MAGIFDIKSTKEFLDAAQKKATEILGEDGVGAIKNAKDSVVEAGSALKNSAQKKIDEMTKEAETTKNTKTNNKSAVDATLAFIQERREEYKEEKHKQEERSRKTLKVLIPIFALVLIGIFGMTKIQNSQKEKASIAEEAALQLVVQEIQEDISAGRYDEAIVKANGLYYTSGYSNEIKKKWNSTRNALIDEIEAARKQTEQETMVVDANDEITDNENIQGGKTDQVSYSTNGKDTVKNGNTGIYSYRSRGGEYYIYYIIDFDEGYVYRFCEGNGDAICDRVKIETGDLNNVLIITYHDGEDSWSYGLHFKWKNQPDTLIVQEEDGYEYAFYSTDLQSASALKESKTIYDY